MDGNTALLQKNNVKKAILITRDMKTDITYFPDNQTVEGYRPAGNTETIRVAKTALCMSSILIQKVTSSKSLISKPLLRFLRRNTRTWHYLSN